MKRRIILMTVLVIGIVMAHASSAATGYKVVGWNNLGMHCMDADFSVLSILPPYNTIQAQVIDPSGNLVTNPTGITVTYQGVADPDGSINTASAGKTGFWQYVQALFGVSLAVDHGLAGSNMPGSANTPQPMTFDPATNWFIAEGIPLTPYDNAGNKNPYPLMRIVARDASGNVLATTDIVLPVSDEMDCSACHASGSSPAARPAAGWVYNSDPQKDYRLNVLRLHDDFQLGSALYTQALAAAGYSSSGLYPTASSGTPVLCAKCHGSNALPGTGYTGVEPLTAAMHYRHATVVDPTNGLPLDSSTNRSACYRCHPGSETRCLRGAMGAAVASNGQLAMQCQSCHGSMSRVGEPTRQGWLDEPACQQCHTGTATHNNGQLLYTSVFDSNGQPRTAVDATFATNPDTPGAGFSLYRFSSGHGGLQCAACHGSTHAEYKSSHRNDNIENTVFQGHAGVLAECDSCHGSQPSTVSGGPHGMHPVGQTWVSRHQDAAEGGGAAACQACHGTDYRGTILSRSQADRTISAFGTKTFWRGFQIGCYTCHNGPSNDSGNSNHPAVVSNLTAQTPAGTPVAITLQASDADGNSLTLRVVSQPANGTVGLTGTTATYYPAAGFSGTDTFTYAAWDGSTDSNLGTVGVTVAGGACQVSCSASAPSTATTGAAVAFTGSANASGCSGSVTYDWNFGDGAHAATATASHTNGAVGTYTWVFTATSGSASCTKTGSIVVTSPQCNPPQITVEPADQRVRRGLSARLSVTATGQSLAYQWYRGASGNTSQPISGATSSTYTTPRLYSTTTYWVRVRNSCGAVNSRTVTVTVRSED